METTVEDLGLMDLPDMKCGSMDMSNGLLMHCIAHGVPNKDTLLKRNVRSQL